jgi:hypothetical protein
MSTAIASERALTSDCWRLPPNWESADRKDLEDRDAGRAEDGDLLGGQALLGLDARHHVAELGRDQLLEPRGLGDGGRGQRGVEAIGGVVAFEDIDRAAIEEGGQHRLVAIAGKLEAAVGAIVGRHFVDDRADDRHEYCFQPTSQLGSLVLIESQE